MKAAIFSEPRKIGIKDIPKPVPEDEDVLVKVKACAICGSDQIPYLNIDWEDRKNIIPGHEITGTIVEAGSKVKDFKEGEKVAVYAIIYCDKCHFCERGLKQFCESRKVIGFHTNGGYAEYVKVPERCLLRLPEGISFEEGTLLLDAIGVPAYGLKRVTAKNLDTFAVFGCGNIGLGTIITLKTFEKENIFAIDVVKNRLKTATILGAKFAIDAKKKDSVEKIRELTNGIGVDLAVDASGASKAEIDAIESVGVDGKVLFLGENRSFIQINPSKQIIHKNLILIGANYFPKEEFENNVKIFLKKREDFRKTISHSYPLEKINEAFQIFFNKDSANRIIINP